MMIYKKSMRIIFAVMLACVILNSCGEPAKENTAGTVNTEDAANTAEQPAESGGESSENQLVAPNLPDTDWQGQTATFLVRGVDFAEWQSQDIYAEEETGEPVNDAVYKRNAILEDRYNFFIREKQGGSGIQSEAEKSILSGSNAYQVIMANTQETNNMAMKGHFYDLRNIGYIDIDREYWDQNSVYGFTVGGRTMFMTGDLSIMANDATWIFMFNKKLLQDLQLQDPYALAREGKWTADALYDMIKGAAKDLNGDGVMKGADDMFGLATHDSTFDGLFFSMGMRVSAINAEGYPELTMNNERITHVMDKTALIMDKSVTFNGDWQPIAACFEENRTLFYGEVLQCVIRRRSMDTDFGVLPLPKLGEQQEQYAHMVHVTACMVGVPASLGDDGAEFTGFVLEALAAESKNWLVPAYYTTALEGKFMRDEESKDMLDIILKTRRYDLGYAANWGSLFTSYVSAVKKGNSDFASVWDKSSEKAAAAMQKAVDSYMEN